MATKAKTPIVIKQRVLAPTSGSSRQKSTIVANAILRSKNTRAWTTAALCGWFNLRPLNKVE